MTDKLTEDQLPTHNHKAERIADAQRSDTDIEMRRALLKRIAATGFVAPAVLATLLHTPAAASVIIIGPEN